MKSQVIVPLILGIVIVVGAVWYGVSQKNNQSLEGESQEMVEETENQNNFTGTMRELVSRNEPVACTVSHSTDAGSSEGVVYVAQGKIRGNFNITSPTGVFEAYLLTDGEYSYVWSSLLPQGFQIAIAEEPGEASIQAADGLDYDQTLSYDCEPWTPDPAAFVLPADVTFVAPTQFQ